MFLEVLPQVEGMMPSRKLSQSLEMAKHRLVRKERKMEALPRHKCLAPTAQEVRSALVP